MLLIIAIEVNRPLTYFYRSLYITSQTSTSLHATLISAFKEDGIYNVIKSNIRAFVSDGASSLVGRKSGLAKLLNDTSKFNIYTVGCMAHRLQLAVGHALEDIDHFHSEFQTIINNFYNFYHQNSFKRKESLIKTAEILRETYVQINYVHTVRWLPSERAANEKIYHNLHSLINNMDIIATSKEFEKNVAQKALAFRKILTNSRFITTLVFLIDTLKVLEAASLQFQRSSQSLIGKEAMRISLIKSLQILKSDNGNSLHNFIKKRTVLQAIRVASV